MFRVVPLWARDGAPSCATIAAGMGKRLRGRAAGRDAARTSSRPQTHTQRTPDRTQHDSPAEPQLLHRADAPTVQRMVGDLQQSHGNAYVNRLLAPATVQRA